MWFYILVAVILILIFVEYSKESFASYPEPSYAPPYNIKDELIHAMENDPHGNRYQSYSPDPHESCQGCMYPMIV
jgi:hypothetical protein